MAFASVPTATVSSSLYPVALNVRGRRCVVVGGGSVGARRASSLAEAGADVLIVAPEASEAVLRLAEEGRVVYLAEPFSPEHLVHSFLVVVATDRPEINQAVADAARERGALLNLAADTEDGEAGDFATMAAVRRGDLLLGITTGGAGPALTSYLRLRLEQEFDTGWERYIDLLREMRAVAKSAISDPEMRARALRRLAASDSIREKAIGCDMTAAREEAMACLSE